MEKGYKTVEDGSVYVDGLAGSKLSNKNHSPFSYVDEWNSLFMCPDFVHKTRSSALKGAFRNTRFRSICWKLHLDCLPEDQTKWIMHTRKQRQKYQDLTKIIQNNPRGTVNNKDNDLNVNNPLSQEKTSDWNQYFEDSELKETIKQDVKRTFPEIDFFQIKWVRNLMIQILFCYAKEFKKISYKQGMHELLAPILFILYSDQQAFLHASEGDVLKLFYSFTREMIRELMDPTYLEHDTYTLFSQLMDSVEQWYLIRDLYPIKRDPCSVEPFARPHDADLSNIVILKLKRINDHLLKKHDSELFFHLERMEIAPQIYGIRWLRLLFGREFSLQDLLVIWDALFADGPSLGLVDYIFVSMLMYIRSLLLTNDYASCLTFLMRYPGISDVSYIIDHALFLREPMKYAKPTSYSEKMIKHVPTVGGIPNIHRAPQQSEKHNSASKSQVTPRKRVNAAADRPSSLAFGDFVEIDKDGRECNLSSSDSSSLRSSLPSINNLVGKTEARSGSIWKSLDVTDSRTTVKRQSKSRGEELTEMKTSGKQTRTPPVPGPRFQKKSVKSSSENNTSLSYYEATLKEMKMMHEYCSSKMTASIDKLQDTVLEKNLDNEDDLLLALAALKQVRDILQGTLKFSENLENDGSSNNFNTYTDHNKNSSAIHKSTLTVKLRDKQSQEDLQTHKDNENAVIDNGLTVASNIPTDVAIEALLSSEDCIEPQLGRIQFNNCDSD